MSRASGLRAPGLPHELAVGLCHTPGALRDGLACPPFRPPLSLACAAAALSLSAGCEPRERDPATSAAVPSSALPSSVAAASAEPTSGTERLRVVSYNVNYGVEGDASSIAALRRIDADLVLLQETTDGWEKALGASIGDLYPHRAFIPPTTYIAGGIGVLSKQPIEPKEVMPSPVGWFDAWRVIADTALGEIQVLVVHLRPPLSEPDAFLDGYFTTGRDRRREIEAYAPSLDPSLPTIVAGDFNEDEDGDAVGFLGKRGMRSVLPDFEPDQRTWHWFTTIGEVSARLDHVLVSPELEAVSAHVHEDGKSDHFPLDVVVRRRASAPAPPVD